MTTEIIEINGEKVIFGLLWRRLTELRPEKKEIRELASTENAKYAAVFRRRGVFCGLAPVIPPKVEVYSGAVLIANAGLGENCVVVQRLDEHLYVVVGILGGVPVTGMDLVCDHDTAVAKADEFLQHAGQKQVGCYSNCDFFTGGDAQSQSFDVASLDPAGVPGAKLVKIGADLGVPLIAALLVLVIAGGWFAYDDWQTEQRRKAAAKKKVDPVAEYLKSAAKALSDELTQTATSTGAAYLEIIGNLPVTRAGWRVVGANCQNGQCTITWTRIAGGTNRSFSEGLPIATLSFKPDGKTIEQTINVSPKGTGDRPGLDNLVSENLFAVHAGSLFQRGQAAGVQSAIGSSDFYGLPPGAPKPPAVPGGFLGRGAWSLSGAYPVVREMLYELPANMSLNGLRFVADQTNPLLMNLQAEGYFYVRK